MGYEIVRMMNKRPLPPPEKSVWKALGDHASDIDGKGAWPSQKTLAEETGYSERQVRNILRRLEARGAIVETRKPGRRTSREYRIVLNPPTNQATIRPEEIAALDGTAIQNKTGSFDIQDRKSLHQGRQSEAVKSGRDFRQTLIEPEFKNPKKQSPQNARARESQDVDVDNSKPSESEAVKNQSLVIRPLANLVLIPAQPEPLSSEAIQKRKEERKTLLDAQAEYIGITAEDKQKARGRILGIPDTVKAQA